MVVREDEGQGDNQRVTPLSTQEIGDTTAQTPKSRGEIERELIDSKAAEIMPLLNGISYTIIESIADQIKRNARLIPIQTLVQAGLNT